VLALRKVIPNIIRAIKKIIIGSLKFDFKIVKLSLIELLGIFSGIFFFKSFYRPNNN